MHELNIAADRLDGYQGLIDGDAGHIGIEKRDDCQVCQAEFRIVLRLEGVSSAFIG
jgi:IS5 family transposase